MKMSLIALALLFALQTAFSSLVELERQTCFLESPKIYLETDSSMNQLNVMLNLTDIFEDPIKYFAIEVFNHQQPTAGSITQVCIDTQIAAKLIQKSKCFFTERSATQTKKNVSVVVATEKNCATALVQFDTQTNPSRLGNTLTLTDNWKNMSPMITFDGDSQVLVRSVHSLTSSTDGIPHCFKNHQGLFGHFYGPDDYSSIVNLHLIVQQDHQLYDATAYSVNWGTRYEFWNLPIVLKPRIQLLNIQTNLQPQCQINNVYFSGKPELTNAKKFFQYTVDSFKSVHLLPHSGQPQICIRAAQVKGKQGPKSFTKCQKFTAENPPAVIQFEFETHECG